MSADQLVVTASPHIKGPDSTPRIMWTVVGSLVPVVLAATWYFGPSALLVLAAAVHLFMNGFDILLANYALPTEGSVTMALFFGFSAAMLGISAASMDGVVLISS